MDQDTLVKPAIEAGEALLARLDADGVVPDAAMWFWVEDQDQWWYVVGGGRLDHMEPKAGYEAVHGALAKLDPPFPIEMNQISVQRMDGSLLDLMSKFVRLEGIGGARLTENVVNGVVIRDVYLYRISPKESISPKPKPAPTSRTGAPPRKRPKRR